eukprot:765650-Hanusia_phi.AAC.3
MKSSYPSIGQSFQSCRVSPRSDSHVFQRVLPLYDSKGNAGCRSNKSPLLLHYHPVATLSPRCYTITLQ